MFVEEPLGGGHGFPKAGRAAPRDFPRAGLKGNPKESPCQPNINPVLPDSFTPIYIIFFIGFCIGPLQLHRWFYIGLPKILRMFRIGTRKMHTRFAMGYPQVYLNLFPPELHTRGIM